MKWFACFAALLLLFSASCARKPSEGKLRILTTFLPAYCLAANIAGDGAEVENLLEAGASLHDYQLSPGDIRKIAEADVIVANGLGLETFLQRAIANAGRGAKEKVVLLSAGLHDSLIHEELTHRHSGAKHQHAHDPHIWLDPALAAHSVSNLLTALQRIDPARTDVYATNAADYVERLRALDAEIARTLEPVRESAFVTYHNAFRYFVRRYSLNLAGVVEEIPDIAPSSREMSALLQTIREKKVKALFTEPGAPSRLAQQIAKDAGVKLGELDPLETGKLDPVAYEEGMRRNAETLLEALR